MVRLVREIPPWRKSRQDSVESAGLRRAIELEEETQPMREAQALMFQGFSARWWCGPCGGSFNDLLCKAPPRR